MTADDVIRAAMPDASEGVIDHILWGRTPFPFSDVPAKTIYRAARRYARAEKNGLILCDLCDRIADSGYVCVNCRGGIDP